MGIVNRRAQRLLRSSTGREPNHSRRHGLPEEELLARADEYNRNAELYWQDAVKDAASRERVLRRPFRPTEAADVLYRVGLVLQELHAGAGHVVLDFGAGSCWLSSFLGRMGCQTVSVDVSPTALQLGRDLFQLEHAQNEWFEPQFHVFDGRRLRVDDQSIDRIVCFDAFHHIPNQSETLAEFYRVLRPGGRVVLAEPGEGHQHSGQASHEVERFGVLENELDVQALVQLAASFGFGAFALKPYPSPAALRVSPRQYTDVLEGDWGAFPMDAMRASLQASYVVVFDKGSFAPDSRAPGLLRCDITIPDDSPLRGPAKSVQQVLIRVRNTGDTVWLHRETPYGGFVHVGGHLYDHGGKLLRHDYLYRHSLHQDVRPGEEIETILDVQLPEGAGKHFLRLDLVDDGVIWFSQAGSPTRDVILAPSNESQSAIVNTFAARIALTAPNAIEQPLLPGTQVTIPLTLRNTGRLPWHHAADLRRGSITLGGRILDRTGKVCGNLDRMLLTQLVPPGHEIQLFAQLRAPLVAGAYVIRIDLIREGFFWFEQIGSQPVDIPVAVSDATPESTAPGLLRAEIQPIGSVLSVLPPDGEYRIDLRINNCGNTIWLHKSSSGVGFVTLAAHLYRAAGDLVAWDYVHQSLGQDVPPGKQIQVSLALRAPSVIGDFVLEIDMVDEGIAWFGTLGSATLRLPILVRNA